MIVWQILFCLTLISFLGRAFIPVGYMPDLAGERNSTFSITLCSKGGVTVMQMDFSGEPGKDASDDYSGDNCPFGLNTAYKQLPGQDASAVVGLIAFHPFTLPVSHQALPPLPALGPPLGSRAPPLYLS